MSQSESVNPYGSKSPIDSLQSGPPAESNQTKIDGPLRC